MATLAEHLQECRNSSTKLILLELRMMIQLRAWNVDYVKAAMSVLQSRRLSRRQRTAAVAYWEVLYKRFPELSNWLPFVKTRKPMDEREYKRLRRMSLRQLQRAWDDEMNMYTSNAIDPARLDAILSEMVPQALLPGDMEARRQRAWIRLCNAVPGLGSEDSDDADS